VALFNESLAGRFNEGIARLHGMKGGPPAPQVSPEIQHVIQLEPPGTEHRVLFGWRYYYSAITLAASANIGVVTLTNPPGSGILAVIEKCRVLKTATAISSVLDLRGNATQAATARRRASWRRPTTPPRAPTWASFCRPT
jgi:hypothetical protein